jgi:ABC-type spermidine/putrescine transport system permease subunit II
MTRPGLRTFDLTSRRASVRQALTYVMLSAALVAAVGYVLPAHRLDGDAGFHSNFADGGVLPVILLGFAAAVVFALRKLRFGAGMISGIVSGAAAFFSVVPVILIHMFDSYEEGYGEALFAVGVLALFASGVLSLVVEPVLYVLERRRIERDARPAALPVATIASPF